MNLCADFNMGTIQKYISLNKYQNYPLNNMKRD